MRGTRLFLIIFAVFLAVSLVSLGLAASDASTVTPPPGTGLLAPVTPCGPECSGACQAPGSEGMVTPAYFAAQAISHAEGVAGTQYVAWQALNILNQIFVHPQTILSTDSCRCDYPCGGLCPPCVPVSRAKILGPYCTEVETWAQVCSRITDWGRYGISSPCPYWIIFEGVQHTVPWNPSLSCPTMGNDVVIPTPNCVIAPMTPTPEPSRTPTATRTHTPTTTPTPTATPTATATATPHLPDLIADGLEVTQAIQDLNGNVRLVAHKRTFVRFHVHAIPDAQSTIARLTVERGGSQIILSTRSISVRTNPDRGVKSHAFLFELPSSFLSGTVKLTAEVNPEHWWHGRDPEERDYTNNSKSITVVFEDVPPLNLVIYRVGYKSGDKEIYPAWKDVNMMVSWLRRMYPVSRVNVWSWDRDYLLQAGQPTCRLVNRMLLARKRWDLAQGGLFGPPLDARYYGMVDDAGVFMRGCSWGIPSYVASGPTGSGARFAWDTDGSYGDWYAGHELGHAYGRRHVACSGETGIDSSYPHADGNISTARSGPDAFYGYDISTGAIYGPTSKDVMTYCSNMWISEHIYERLMTFIQSGPAVQAGPQSWPDQTDRLLIVGTMNADGSGLELEPLFVLPDIGEMKERVPGPYAIVLGGDSGELARYPFTPIEIHEDQGLIPACSETQAIGTIAIDTLAIDELVPYVAGVTRVDIVGPGGALLKRTAAGPSDPTLSITMPAGGETFGQTPIAVAWTADDPDGDPLTFNVQYSPDNGASWVLLAQNVTASQVTLTPDSVAASSGAQGRFRVWVTDGIHTAFAQSAPFTVSNHPPTVSIIVPEDGITVAVEQTVALVGESYDPDLGFLPDAQLSWLSDRDGLLGAGAEFSTASLSVGVHTITLRADDGRGAIATDSISVTVLGDPRHLPRPQDALLVGPSVFTLGRDAGAASSILYIENENQTNVLPWQAVASEPWISLSRTSGHTPGEIVVGYREAGLPLGEYAGDITITSTAFPGQQVVIPVDLILANRYRYLPIMLKNPGAGPQATPTPTRTPTRTPTGTPTGTPTPTTTPSVTGINGRVTYNGLAAAGVGLSLRFYNGAAWTTAATTSTNAAGKYAFVGVPGLAAGQTYYVRYGPNSTDPTRVYAWYGPDIAAYSAGASLPGGDFDIENVALLSPAPGATVSLPASFTWTRRGAPNDSYRWEVFEIGGTNAWWTRDLLGDVGSFTLEALPDGASYGVKYGWDMLVYNSPDSYGSSYHYQTITFAASGGAMSLSPGGQAVERQDVGSKESRPR